MPDQQIIELQRIADYYTVRKSVRMSGYVSILFGVLAMIRGAIGLVENPINALLFLLGVILIIVGVVNCVRPTPLGILADGISLLVIGCWNIFIFVVNSTVPNSRQGGTPIIAIFQIIWGITSFSRYKRFANAFNEHPTPTSLAQMDQLIKDMRKAKFKSSPDIIEFLMQSASRQMPTKGRLMDDRAVFAMGGSQEILIAAKSDITITPTGKSAFGKTKSVTFTFGDRAFKGSITEESLNRFNEWKNAQTMYTDLPFIT